MIRKNRFFIFCLVAVFWIPGLTGCKKEQQPAAPAVQQATPQAKPVQKPVSSALLHPSSTANKFDFSNKKDPFKPFVLVKTPAVRSPESAKKLLRDSLPIHSLDVSQFRLIGVITGGKESKAMVTDPEGKGYVLTVGMSIGRNNGKVVAISPVGVEVVELFRDENGRVHRENIKLTLPRKQ